MTDDTKQDSSQSTQPKTVDKKVEEPTPAPAPAEEAVKEQTPTEPKTEASQAAEKPEAELASKPDESQAETSQPKTPEPLAVSNEPDPLAYKPMPKPPKIDPKGTNWYVVHTYSGHEAKVAATLKQRVESQKLQDKILDILVPTQEKIEIKEGKKTNIKEKIFPGYLLIRMILDDNTWLAVRTTPGITSFVGNANKPTPLPEEEVTSIKRFMAMEAPKFKAAFAVAEAVRITDGPFSEFLGTISEIDEEKGKLKVMVSIFGRETPVELDFLQVAKL